MAATKQQQRVRLRGGNAGGGKRLRQRITAPPTTIAETAGLGLGGPSSPAFTVPPGAGATAAMKAGPPPGTSPEEAAKMRASGLGGPMSGVEYGGHYTPPGLPGLAQQQGAAVPPSGNGAAAGGSTAHVPLEEAQRRLRLYETRNIVHQMAKDGTLLRALQASIEENQYAPPMRADRDVPVNQRFSDRGSDRLETASGRLESDRRYQAEALHNRAQAAQQDARKNPRHDEFLTQLDIEHDRTMHLIEGLEQRLGFLMYAGPTDQTTAAPREMGGMSVGPVNPLEQKIVERMQRASLIRSRLEALHESLRT